MWVSLRCVRVIVGIAGVTSVFLLAGCGAGEEARPQGATTLASAAPSADEVTSPPDESPATHTIDPAAPPDYVRFTGWRVERFPIPKGTEPITQDGRRGDFSAYVVYSGGDLELISEFYRRVLPRLGYTVNVDDYGAVKFRNNTVEGGVVAGRGDVAVWL